MRGMSYISFSNLLLLNETYFLPENFCECVASFKTQLPWLLWLYERGMREAGNQPWDADQSLPILGSCVHPVTLCETGLLLFKLLEK